MRLLVRHAHAGDKRHWSGPDTERPLSIGGWGQAEGLLDTLAVHSRGRQLQLSVP